MPRRYLVPSLAVVLVLSAVPGSAQRFGGPALRPAQGTATKVQTPAPQGQQATRPPDPRSQQQPSAERFLQAGWDWWKDEAVKKELNLTERQTFRITAIVNGRVKQVTPYYDELQRQLAELDRLTRERVVDDATYTIQVSRVESLRSKLNESRTVMLYQILRQLDPAQYQKLQEIRDRRRGGRGGGPALPRTR